MSMGMLGRRPSSRGAQRHLEPVRRRSVRRHHAVRRLATTGVFGVLLLGLAVPAVGPAAATEQDRGATVGIVVDQVSPQVLTPGEDLSVTATVTNSTDQPLSDVRAAVRIHRFRMVSRTELADWADAGTGGTVGAVAATVLLPDQLAPAASTQVQITVPAGSVGLLNTPDAWGPRGMALEITSASRRVGLARTFVLWDPAATVPSSRVSVLVPIVGSPPSASGGTPASTGSLDEVTGTGPLRAILDATAAAPAVSWAVDPSLLQSAAAGDPSARSWASDLLAAASRRDVVALPWADPDVAALARPGRTDLLGAAVDLSAASASPVLASTPGHTVLAWAVDGEADEQTAALVAGSTARALVVGPGQAAARNRGATTGGVSQVMTDTGPLTLLTPDETLSTLLAGAPDGASDNPAASSTARGAGAAAQRVLAETALIARSAADTTGRSSHILVTTPRSWDPDPQVARAQLAALGAAPWVQTAPITALLGTAADATDRAPLPTTARSTQELPASAVDALGDARQAVVRFAAVLEHPDTYLAGADQAFLAPLSVGWRADPAGRSDQVDAALAVAAERTAGLSVALNDRFTVVSRTSHIRAAVSNSLDQAATVRVHVQPRKACLRATGEPTVTVPAHGEHVVEVELRASASCDVEVDVLLLAPDGTVVAAPVRFSAQVAPAVESIGTWAVAIALALAVAVGLVRTSRRGRSASRGARVATDPGADADDPPRGRDDPAAGSP